jgi:septal ring factor EnvC (AmiA/AmiB activator)
MEALQGAAKLHAAAIKDLKDLVPKLDEEVSKSSGLGQYEEELKTGSMQVSPDVRQVALSQPGRMKPSIPFARAKGLLPLPAEGEVLVKFGQSHDGSESKGLRIATRQGAQVTAPCDGWIVYAGQFRNYGQLLIINAGGGYHILLAGMERIQAEVGQFILAGEPVAAMGGEPQVHADEQSAVHPTLYVEFRRDQQPVDPAPWWSVGGGKG